MDAFGCSQTVHHIFATCFYQDLDEVIEYWEDVLLSQQLPLSSCFLMPGVQSLKL